MQQSPNNLPQKALLSEPAAKSPWISVSLSKLPISSLLCASVCLYVVFKGSWDMEKHRRSSPFLFGSFSFVDGGGIVDNFCRFCLSRGLVRGWNRRRRCFVPWDFVKPDTEIRPASCSGGPP